MVGRRCHKETVIGYINVGLLIHIIAHRHMWRHMGTKGRMVVKTKAWCQSPLRGNLIGILNVISHIGNFFIVYCHSLILFPFKAAYSSMFTFCISYLISYLYTANLKGTSSIGWIIVTRIIFITTYMQGMFPIIINPIIPNSSEGIILTMTIPDMVQVTHTICISHISPIGIIG